MAQKILCHVDEIVPHGEHVYSVLLEPASPLPRFRPGQFLHLALDPFRPGDFWPDSRAFSIVNSPSQVDFLRITYAVKGVYTSRMERELERGRDLWVKLPYGEFIVDRCKDVCLLAGGTGITAFTAFLSDLPADHPNHVHLFYGARRAELLVYRTLVAELGARCPNVRAHLFSEQVERENHRLVYGRLDIEHVSKFLTCPADLTHYLAGPPAMIEALTDGLVSLGVAASRIVIDAWE